MSEAETSDDLALTPAQTVAAASLAGGSGASEAARAAGVSRGTVYQWADADADFASEVNRARREQRDALRSELRGLTADAVKSLRDLMTADAPAPVRLRAALAVLRVAGADAPEEIGPVHPGDVGQEWLTRDLFRKLGSST